MADTDIDLIDDVVDAAADRGDNLVTTELTALVERHDPVAIESNAFGVSVDRLVAYADALPEGGHEVTPDDVRAAAAEAVESESWVGGGRLYATGDGHVSVYPREWHEALAGEDDVRRFVETIIAEVGDSEAAFGEGGGRGPGVPENVLLNAVTVLGTPTWEEAKAQLESLRDDDVVAERLDQHPDARVELVGVDHG
ncbi:hypothetical protein [Halogeometricum sp. CBA1124]|uniref:hypothetical protein n=1 Tax=Halogeometricum sp. CBA1124 TaxID=2668071 RepID=UPI00142B2900|nr:hypothetical protein [Halogeometricum sp. CBA1124]MUV57442.1 hypothetical protein [Halogeometricum sp. CBA1124]